MKAYIAYKYSNHHDKELLISSLEKLSSILHSWGITTFILGRDIKKWKHLFLGTIRLLPLIIKNMNRSDIVIAYVDSTNISKGLFLESLISKILGKKSIMILVNGTRSKFNKYFFTKLVSIKSIENLKNSDLSL